jgi:hypothetical protein
VVTARSRHSLVGVNSDGESGNEVVDSYRLKKSQRDDWTVAILALFPLSLTGIILSFWKRGGGSSEGGG